MSNEEITARIKEVLFQISPEIQNQMLKVELFQLVWAMIAKLDSKPR